MYIKMFVCVTVFCFAISPAVGSVVRSLASIPSYRETKFTCSDGTCIGADLVCDTNWDCPDGLDEASCSSSTNSILTDGRYKRQTSQCRKYQWQCRDGTCISSDGKCDGVIDCPDRSDETHPLCRMRTCPSNLFRCTYGACVDSTAPCNQIVECADHSDELLRRCRNETSSTNGKFRCLDGNNISNADYCDGIPNCPDGSDETVAACADKKCPAHLFQCAYGACADQDADCNGKEDCADGSDETDELCNRLPAVEVQVPPRSNFDSDSQPAPAGKCMLPEYPEHGTYVVANAPHAKPGQSLQTAQLFFTCDEGYGVIGDEVVFCNDGALSAPVPKICVRLCKLDEHPSVKYTCIVTGRVEGERACKPYEPSGTTIRPKCNTHYYSPDVQRFMRCIDGEWNYIATCNADCGRLTPAADALISGGREALRGEVPWHVGIYRKPTDKIPFHEQICGGSLVTNNVVISAAHCFWNDVGKQQPASKYAVAIAKLFREWDHKDDRDAQKSDIETIDLPPLFLGGQANFQEDIAVLILKTPFTYYNYVRPVCLNFDVRFNNRQLQPGNLGKVAGWGLTGEKGNAAEVLQTAELPFVDIDRCIALLPVSFRGSITGDKICAGHMNGTAVCKGDSGGGLAFPEVDRGFDRYYLRGVVSSAPRPGKMSLCNAFTITTFTQILKHQHYLYQFL